MFETTSNLRKMALYAIGDLHLSLTRSKPMDIFGSRWADHASKLKEAFSALKPDDVTVLCGDISWGMSLSESLEDFKFINDFPGKKYIVKGNHDYWFDTASKLSRFFAENGIDTIEMLHNNCRFYGGTALCGTRGWFTDEDGEGSHNTKMFRRELIRLEASFKAAGSSEIICFLHYPPKYESFLCPEIMELLKKYGVKRCYYGHLHGQAHRGAVQGMVDGIEFSLISADYLNFTPIKILA